MHSERLLVGIAVVQKWSIFHFLPLLSGGAAPLGKELQISVSKKLGVFLAQTWGLSETTGSATGGDVNYEDLSGSTGPLLSHLLFR